MTTEERAAGGEFERPEGANRLNRVLARLEKLPRPLRGLLRQWLLHYSIPFTGTAGIVFDTLDPDLVRVRLNNRRRVQNHIRGVHAAAAALLAETASGLAVGMHLPDDRLPLLKTMAFRYTRRARGGLTADATLTDEQIAELQSLERGEVKVAVNVWDEENEKPLECVLVWAWVPKRK